MTTKIENRRSFRVHESVYLTYEKLTDEEFAAGIEHHRIRTGTNAGAQSMLVDIEARLSEAMFLLNGEHGAVGRCITLLNDKINIAIGELPGLREAKSRLAQQPPQHCDVGADGLVFSSRESMKIGDKLYIQLLLASDSRYVESFAHVVRLTDPPDSSDPAYHYGIAVEFVNMPTAQREILIQYMFSRESETLRMRRLEIDAEEFPT